MTSDDWIKKIKTELNRYEIGGNDLDEIFAPLLEACSKVARNYNEFKQCVHEGISTLRSVVNKVKF